MKLVFKYGSKGCKLKFNKPYVSMWGLGIRVHVMLIKLFVLEFEEDGC
jgi:hypothetical protein